MLHWYILSGRPHIEWSSVAVFPFSLVDVFRFCSFVYFVVFSRDDWVLVQVKFVCFCYKYVDMISFARYRALWAACSKYLNETNQYITTTVLHRNDAPNKIIYFRRWMFVAAAIQRWCLFSNWFSFCNRKSYEYIRTLEIQWMA